MDLMSLLAKLTLDKTEYDKGIEEAEKKAEGMTIPQPKIPKPDNTEFDAGVKEAEGTGNLFKEVMVGVWEGIKDAIVVTGITSAVMGVVGAMRQGVDMAIENGKAISDGARTLGISTKAYQQYEYALGKSGLKVKDLSHAFDGLNKIFAGDLSEKQAGYVKELEEMGFTADKAASKEENLASMMQALADYQGDDKGLIIDWLFGKDANWDGFFDQTSSDINKLKRDAEKAGSFMPDEAIDNAVEFRTATQEINDQIEALKLSFGESVLPMLTDAVKMVSKIVAFFSGGDKSLAEKFAGDDKEFAEELLTIEGTAAAAETLADKLLEMGDTSKMTADQYEIWKGTAETLIGLVPELGGVIDTETGKISANSKEIKENIKQWEALAKQKALQNLKEKKYQEIVEANEELIEKSVDANEKLSKASSERRKSLEEVNKVLEKYGHEGLGEESTIDDLNKAKQDILLGMSGDEYGMSQFLADIGNASSKWSSAVGEARSAQADVDKLTAQIEAAKTAFDEWSATADSMFGGTSESAEDATGEVNALAAAIAGIPNEKFVKFKITEERAFAHAIGSAYVPYDNYPALLHRGEKVLTRTEARKEEQPNTDLSGLEDRLAAAIRSGMNGVTVNSYLNGRSVTEEVNKESLRQVKARRFAR